MKNKKIILEEINQIQYLFGYKRGVVISEQLDPEKKKEYDKKFEIAKKKGYMIEAMYFEYLSKEQDVKMLQEKIDQTKIDEINDEYQKQNPSTSQTPELPKTKTEPNMPLLGNLVGNDLTSAYNVLIGYFEGTKNFDEMSAFSTLLANREKQISMVRLQNYLNDHVKIDLEKVYASITDKPKYEQIGIGIKSK